METQPERNEIVKRAVEAGIDNFDTTWTEETKSLGLALKALGKREDIHIAVMIVPLLES